MINTTTAFMPAPGTPEREARKPSAQPVVQLCQRCRLPLRIHESLEDLSAAQFNLLVSSTATGPGAVEYPANLLEEPTKQAYPPDRLGYYGDAARTAGTATPRTAERRASAFSARTMSLPTDSFVYLTQSHVTNAQPVLIADVHHVTDADEAGLAPPTDAGRDEHSLSSKFKSSDRLFDMLSNKSDIDHPICTECTELLIERLKQQFAETRKDRDAYIEFLNQMQNDVPTKEEEEVAAKELERIEREQAAVLDDLNRVEAERRQVEAEVADLERQSAELDAEEAEFWAARNAFAEEYEGFLSERDAIKLQYQYDVAHLDKLRATNVYSDILAIEGEPSTASRMPKGSRRR
ncbi:autophagy protein Apg6-domain-containing protein [Dipodascopsis tothii]|uniref:autophagy protein Apg6-domain-containing protein n=1 Tax=Dipodascopsis tothii TaxID=44089 RepID=UPI0034CD8F25